MRFSTKIYYFNNDYNFCVIVCYHFFFYDADIYGYLKNIIFKIKCSSTRTNSVFEVLLLALLLLEANHFIHTSHEFFMYLCTSFTFQYFRNPFLLYNLKCIRVYMTFKINTSDVGKFNNPLLA